ncbi:hypothetical protein [Leptospira jelokensis]|uniref:hypothetical protein n=1 Tax=Leptospira jelokensis TaxID=2484931 RepID=UPI001ABF33D9|nr:hypothetical protein [Leptospira jelokensis]
METDPRLPITKSRIGIKWKVFFVTICLLVGIFSLDRILFNELYFLFPNETEWDSSPWYNFIYKTKSLQKQKKEHRTIITGSSVALYSVLPDELNQKENRKTKYDFFSHVAMSPTDLYYYKETLLSTRPDVVVYLHNFADLQWEYLEKKDQSLEFQEEIWINQLADRYPTKTIYPTQYLKDYWNRISRKSFSKLATKSMFYVSRFRVFFWDPIIVYIDNHFRSGRKYHLYQGAIPKEGIWSKGWTKESANIRCSEQRERESIFIQKPNTDVTFQFYQNQKTHDAKTPSVTIQKSFPKSGWTDIEWNELVGKENDWQFVQIQVNTNLTTAKEVNLIRYGKDEPVGIRLSHFFCKPLASESYAYSRRSFWDDTRFIQMSDSEFRNEYFERMIRDSGNRNELFRLHKVREAKKMVNAVGFEPWKEYNRILEISDYFQSKKIPFVLVLSPENPIEFAFYKDSQWRKEWVGDLRRKLEERGQVLIDHTEVVKDVRYFFDPHHLTYEGASYYNYIFAKSVEPYLSHPKTESFQE